MSSRSVPELDFFNMEKEKEHNVHARRVMNFREISKINPVVLRSVIATGTTASAFVNSSTLSCPSTPISGLSSSALLPSSPAYDHPLSRTNVETAPMTIFYDGVVHVYDLPRHKAHGIMKIAMEMGSSNGLQNAIHVRNTDTDEACSPREIVFFGTPHGDLPIARRKSLQRFLEKRKERLISVSPYTYGIGSSNGLAC